MSRYDIAMIGHISKDIMIFGDREDRYVAGPVIYSSMAATRSGAGVLVITKAAREDAHNLDQLTQNNIDVTVLQSPSTTSIRNVYHSDDRERRTITLLSRASSFLVHELPDFDASIIHCAGLFRGEIPDELLPSLADKAKVGLDAQGVLRCDEDSNLLFRDWEAKQKFLPYITYLKTDAAEAEILTGSRDRITAAKLLKESGADEVMITHNEEVIVFDGSQVHRAPFTPQNLSGRTGRGDTCFASYLARRLTRPAAEAVRYAAALTSIKMETPGPFTGSHDDVLTRMEADSS